MLKWTQLFLTLASGLALSSAVAFTALNARVDAIVNSSRAPNVTRRACALAPFHALCRATLARQKEEFGFDASQEWIQALRLEPRDLPTALASALSHEAGGHLEEAERLLTISAANGHIWGPRWALASFYYRQQRWPEFWHWARLALERSPDDPSVLFRLCLSAGGSAQDAAARALPGDVRLQARFVEFLATQPEAAGAASVVRGIQAFHDAAEREAIRPALLRATEMLMARHLNREAHQVWMQMGRLQLFPSEPWSERSPLMNGDFEPPFDPPGFDWRVYRQDGLETLLGAPAGSVKFTFSGKQAEQIPLLEQFIWLPAGKPYELDCEFRARRLEPGPAGLEWWWQDASGAKVPLRSAPPRAAEDWTGWRFSVPAPATEGVHKLILWAGRPAGLTRLCGEAWVRQVRLRPSTGGRS